MPALVAADRSHTGLLVGTSFVWRSVASLAIYPVLLLLSHLLGYGDDVRVVITLLFVGYAFSAISNVGQFAMVGLERVEVAAYRQILEQLAVLAIVVPILMLGGGLNAALVGHAVVTVLVLAYISYALRTAKVGRLSVSFATLQSLLSRGTPFVSWVLP